MASCIGRRKFLATLGGAAAWPFPARFCDRHSRYSRKNGHRKPLLGHTPPSGCLYGGLTVSLSAMAWLAEPVPGPSSIDVGGPGQGLATAASPATLLR
jgi:hypothetical protein